MTWEQWTLSLGAIPLSLAAIRIMLWNLGRKERVSSALHVFGLGASALCVVLAIIWQIHANNPDWRPPRNDEDAVGGLILWTLYWNAFWGVVTAASIRAIDKLIIKGVLTGG
ncbi:hypothetical protein [Rathayibacter sp. AY1D3]|uniref:hypothetical protein n=1 Tax=Rathayibacter sp. AY1D3 TaxID=2080544 RepID=UPI000CE78591|nr:hypothetical protein [Rathayibacter sp. AY1D3]PPH85154.1 hypothetical protein C5C64_16915 [Rathayibacter sp. AY1D3]